MELSHVSIQLTVTLHASSTLDFTHRAAVIRLETLIQTTTPTANYSPTMDSSLDEILAKKVNNWS
jgi:hypothetical protein